MFKKAVGISALALGAINLLIVSFFQSTDYWDFVPDWGYWIYRHNELFFGVWGITALYLMIIGVWFLKMQKGLRIND